MDPRFGIKDLAVVGMTGVSTLHQKPNGNYVLFGQSQSGSNGNKTTSNLGGWDYWWVEINSDGKKVSEKRFGGELADNGRIIIRASDDEFLVGGHSWSGHSESKSQSNRGNSAGLLKPMRTAIVITPSTTRMAILLLGQYPGDRMLDFL